MYMKNRIMALILTICMLVFICPVSMVNANTTTVNLCWDSTGTNPNGIRLGGITDIGYYNWNVQTFLFNKTWDSCASFKVGCRIQGEAAPLYVDYVLVIYNGARWIQTNAIVRITQKNTEYIFEPAFLDPASVQAFAIYPAIYNDPEANYSWSYDIYPYTMTDGVADQVAFIDDFDFNVSQNRTVPESNGVWYHYYMYKRDFHFYDSFITKIANKYYLKGKYYVQGNSYICMSSIYGSYYEEDNQSSFVDLTVNNINFGSFNMSGRPSSLLTREWYYPDGANYEICLGATRPASLTFQAVHGGTGGYYVQTIPQATTNHIISLDINTKPNITTITNPLQNQVFSDTDTNLAPVITVSDEDNQTLTCKYYVDSEPNARDTKTVSNTSTLQTISFAGFNVGSLSDGTHVVRFEANDGKEASRTHAAIKVDRRAPSIVKVKMSSSSSSITVAGTAKDTVSPTGSLLYSYACNQFNSGWITSNTYTINSLQPNTKYTVKFYVKDEKGHVSESQGTYYTKAQ